MANQTKKPFHKTSFGILIMMAFLPFTLTYMISKSKYSDEKKGYAYIALWTVVILFSWAMNHKADETALKVASNTQESQVQVEQAPENKAKYTLLTGIEREQYSDAYGDLVVPEKNIWEEYGNSRGSVVGKISHGPKVEILEEKHDDNTMLPSTKLRPKMAIRDGFQSNL